jgi:hypothetical protein
MPRRLDTERSLDSGPLSEEMQGEEIQYEWRLERESSRVE